MVLYLHHSDYTADYLMVFRPFGLGYFYQKLAVGGFFFLSGYKLTNSKSLDSIRGFITNRIFRIYFLYLCAIVVFSFTGYPYFNQQLFPSMPNVILHILCLQAILPNYYGNIYHVFWFISILFLCYSFFLATRGIIHKKSFWITLSLILTGIFIIHQLSNNTVFILDITIYLVFFALGMAFSKNVDRINNLNEISLFITSCSGLLLLLFFRNRIYTNTWHDNLVLYILVVISTLPLFILFFKIAPKLFLPPAIIKTMRFISYSSFCVFLLK